MILDEKNMNIPDHLVPAPRDPDKMLRDWPDFKRKVVDILTQEYNSQQKQWHIIINGSNNET